jgi:aryl-alcohol dehydrogenase-like predicted oxidoreductase
LVSAVATGLHRRAMVASGQPRTRLCSSDLESDIKTTTLGPTGLNVTRMAFGTWQLGGEWGHFEEDAAITAIHRARELGVNFFDTAQAYGFGTSEHILGKAVRDELTSARGELVIATKGVLRQTDSGLVRDASPAWLRRGVDASLTALGIDHIDLYQAHWPDPTVPAADTAGALGEPVTDGKVRHVGVSDYDAAQNTAFVDHDWRSASGLFSGAIVAARQSSHVEDSLLAAEVSLTDEDLDDIDRIMTSATPVAGPTPEDVQ